MNYDNSIPSRTPRQAAGAEVIQASRAAPWEPRGARTSRVLIGIVGAALVGTLAIGGVMLSPSRTPTKAMPAGDQVATAPQSQQQQPSAQSATPQPSMTADQMAAQSQQQPTAAGTATAPDQAPSAASTAPTTADTPPATQTAPTSPDTSGPAPKPGSGQ